MIKGSNLVPATTPAAGAIWDTAPEFASGRMPAQLGGVSVTVNDKPAFVYYYCSAATSPSCASDQINVLTPLDATVAPVRVVVLNSGVSTPPFAVNLRSARTQLLLGHASVRTTVPAAEADSSIKFFYPAHPVVRFDRAVIAGHNRI